MHFCQRTGLSRGTGRFLHVGAASRTLGNMQLRAARLCLDCEEIHEGQECPVCLSEAFVYLIRWVPVEERRTRRFPSAIKVTPEPSGAARWVRRGVFGLAVLAASRWLWQSGEPTSGDEADAASRKVPAANDSSKMST
jgi:hypothetical protein